MGLGAARWLSGLAVLSAPTLSLWLTLSLGAGPAFAQGPGPGRGGAGSPARIGGQLRGQGFVGAPQAPAPPGVGVDVPGSLRAFLFGGRGDHSAMPPVARFRLDGGEDFILERGAGTALFKFEDSPEIWALTATAGPRGDTIFKNDVGDPVLRMTRVGGMTLFTDGRPEGMPASVAGPAGSLKPITAIGPDALFRAMAQSSARTSRAAQHLIVFEAPKASEKNDWLFADAAVIVSEAFVRLCQQAPDGRALAQRFARVVFLAGGAAQAEVQGSMVQITVAPNKGVAGRPSSERIFLVLRRR